jgi:hypothetical protein
MLKSNVLEKANLLVHGDRQKDYGHPMTDFSRTAKLWSAILGGEVTAEKVALCMMAVKISRLCQTPDHMDSVVDIAGYAGTYEMVIEKRKEK